MCGITGIVAFNGDGETFISRIGDSVNTLAKRGPDGSGTYKFKNGAFGHTRLSVIDPTQAASQPFSDTSGRYTIIFNGEFFNFKEYRSSLEKKGIVFKSTGDTEVLLQLFIMEGPSCLHKINGFFAFAIYDALEDSLFLARDRVGVKPLLYFQDADKFIFASEMKALLGFGIPKKIDTASLLMYLRLNYIPAPHSIFQQVKKLEPGTYAIIKNGHVSHFRYYKIPNKVVEPVLNYQDAKTKIRTLLEDAVLLRLTSDVPLGAFLSGGIDSSILVSIASREIPQLKTFSIGFKDEPLFDETKYANLLAEKYQTNHTVFSLNNHDLYEHLHDVLDYVDEPFADSSALLVYILSKKTREHVKVALSGDGADELFAGYNKHQAAYNIQQQSVGSNLIKWSLPLWNLLPKSRNTTLGNVVRKLKKFGEGMSLSESERYWQWAGLINDADAVRLLSEISNIDKNNYDNRKSILLAKFGEDVDLNTILRTDMDLVLQNDMLTKVDMMSMANGLEVRVPFLDYRLIDCAFSWPASYKIDRNMRKKVLKDAFRDDLPIELFNRSKQGFEVPLLKWFRTELKSLITEDLLSDAFIESQGLFDLDQIRKLKLKLFSQNVEEAVGQVWGLIVFQYWWKKYMN